jgi:DNA-binding response OmpR family regulator
VDDDDGVRSLARRAFETRGFRVLESRSGSDALDLFDKNASGLDLILLDVTMPGVNGIEVALPIRAGGSQIPILLSSGYDVETSEIASISRSFVLEKPYDVRRLYELTEQALGANDEAAEP